MTLHSQRPAHRRALGEAIRARRKALGWSQEKLAEVVDCHPNYVGYVERAEQNLTIDMLVRFAKALKCSVADVVQDAGV